jgi:nucleoside-diphosphate-sugar epimerase
LAARTDLDEEGGIEGYAVNTDGVRNLMHAIKGAEHIRRAICVSSQLVCDLGYQPKSDTDFRPTTTYGRSKVLTEQIWRDADGGGVEWCIVRPTTVWGPGMGDHYQRFFRMISDGHYVHVGRAQVTKSYGYVGNTVYQIWRLLQAPAHDICGKVFYLADYEPIALQAWADEFQERMAAPPIRRIPLWAAKMVAIAGDFLNQVGFSRCPFNTFRLANVLTSFQVDTANLEALCGPLPYTAKLGAAETVAWLNDLWLPDDEGTTT